MNAATGSARRGLGRAAIEARLAAVLAGPLIRPVEWTLSASVRTLARRRPDVFERLGRARNDAFLIVPRGWPVAFRLEPRGVKARVEVGPAAILEPADVRIAGPLATLLRLFDGSADADAAFFSRDLSVTGDVEAAMALHNALEAAELDLAALAGPAAGALRRLAAGLRRSGAEV